LRRLLGARGGKNMSNFQYERVGQSLDDRENQLYESFSDKQNECLTMVDDYFTDYLMGLSTRQHPDMIEKISEILAGEEEQDIQAFMDYIFIRNLKGCSDEIGKEFVGLYDNDNFKYSDEYTLDNFLLSWRRTEYRFATGFKDTGDYTHIIQGIIEYLEQGRELASHMYHDYSTDTPGKLGSAIWSMQNEFDGFTKLGLVEVLSNNSDICTSLFIDALGEDVREKVIAVVYDLWLANESSGKFLDAFPKFRNVKRYNLGNFLRNYDIYSDEIRHARSVNGGQYSHMYKRLRRRAGNMWQAYYFNLLDEPDRARTLTLVSELGKSGIYEEDKIRLIEGLASKNALKYLNMFADGGSDAEDVLIAMNIEGLDEEERRILNAVVRNGQAGIRQYLGMCKISIPDTASKYDWERGLTEVCDQISPDVFEGNEVLTSILINKARHSYMQDFESDPGATLEKLRSEIDKSKGVYKSILERTLQHFGLRQKLSTVKGMIDRLEVKRA
jgi:hypothetical protein